MFGPAGTLYVYFVYGIHWMLNVVTEKEDFPAAVLIRGVENISGPARVTKKLQITGALNGKMANETTGLWFEARDPKIKIKIQKSARIGVDYAGPVWSKKLLRFELVESK